MAKCTLVLVTVENSCIKEETKMKGKIILRALLQYALQLAVQCNNSTEGPSGR